MLLISRFALKKEDLLERAELMLEQAEKINCRQFVTPKANTFFCYIDIANVKSV